MTDSTVPHAVAPSGGEVVMVSPEVATVMLGHNTHNRDSRASAVAAYAADMTNGDWRWTGDPIRFATDGTLLDGQHRLLAIVESGVTIPLLVIRGLDRDAQEDIDRGVPRKYADVLKLRGESNVVALAALVRRVHMWNLGSRSNAKSGSVTVAQLNRTLADHPELREVVSEARGLASRYGDLPPSLIAFCLWLFASVDQEDADFFMERLTDGQSLASGDPIYELRKQLAGLKANTKGMRSDRYLLAITIKAWNFYRAGEKVGLLKFRSGGAKPESFPEPK